MSDGSDNASSSGKSEKQLLIEKIKYILRSTDPERWKQGGGDLDIHDRFEKPRQTWESVFTLEIPAGVLVLRASTPVTAEFAGRGYGLQPSGDTHYTTEIRASGWHHSELTDPNRRSRASDRRCTVLAEGDIARGIFLYVKNSYTSHFDKKQQSFDKEVLVFLKDLIPRLQKDNSMQWDRNEEKNGEIRFVGHINNMEVTVSHLQLDGREHFEILVSKNKVQSRVRDPRVARELYALVENIGQTSRLMTLTRALEQI